MNDKKKILITGSEGFIGQETLKSLKDIGWFITQGLRNRYQYTDGDIIELDLEKPKLILSLAETHHFDVIVHLGSRIGWFGASDEEMYVPNVLSTSCLALLAKKWNAHLIFASAAIVYGIGTMNITNKSKIKADSAYAKSKLLAEQLIQISGCSYCILRIGGVFGLDGPKHLSLNIAIDEAINGKIPILSGSGKAQRNYIYVKDVALAIVKSIQNSIVGVHLLAGNEVLNIEQMLQQICEIFLPGCSPLNRSGPEASSQVVEVSPAFQTSRKFREALIDIKNSFI